MKLVYIWIEIICSEQHYVCRHIQAPACAGARVRVQELKMALEDRLRA